MSMRRFIHSLRAAQLMPASSLTLALLVLAGGCSKGSGAAPPSLFNNPGDVELICFNGDVDAKDSKVTLPRVCCDDPRSRQKGEQHVAACDGTQPLPHALVTQTVRGEVAAVDLDGRKVLDSERRIPGYTFIDVGGQPTALVAPPSLPCPAGSEEGEVCAALFTYVAGRENNEVRAISSCRFRLGRLCGPDLKGAESEHRRVALLGPPHDMVLDPNGRALWITLPEQGLLARVALGTEDPNLPFAMETEDKPQLPTYFPLAEGVSITPPEPVEEASTYALTCGLGYEYKPLPVKLPNAPHADSTRKPHPTRMQLVDVGETQKMLFVVDDGQAIVHALALTDDDGVEQRALLPVGAPLLDFAVTPGVPALAPTRGDLLAETPTFAYGPDAKAAYVENTKRYLYGIDARDGSVMAFDMTLSGGVPSLQPLLAPKPARDTIRSFGSFADRLGFPVYNVQARTLTVIDTRERLLPTGERDDRYCGQSPDPESTAVASVAELDSVLKNAPAGAAKEVAQHHRDVRDQASKGTASGRLRGVFLLVATTESSAAGEVMVVDVHDLDLQCRAVDNCDVKNEKDLNGASGAVGMAVLRHAARLSGIKATSISVTGTDDLETGKEFRPEGYVFPGAPDPAAPDADAPDAAAPDADAPDADAPDVADDGSVADGATSPDGEVAEIDPCPTGYYQVDDSYLVCAVADPWRTRSGVWSATYRGATSAVSAPAAALLQGEEGFDLTLQAPMGHDFCERGAESEIFAVVIQSVPKKSAGSECERQSDEPWRLLVRKAYTDRLLLELEEDEEIEADQLRACFDDFIAVQLQLADSWRVVSGAASFYQHRVMTAADGTCIVDETRDARFENKADPSQPYSDLNIIFQLRELPSGEETRAAKEAIAPSITLSVSYFPITQSTRNAARADSLPVRMRFFPQSGHIFVVDAASQGLSSLQTLPFGIETSFY
jgi:hypothetical protein